MKVFNVFSSGRYKKARRVPIDCNLAISYNMKRKCVWQEHKLTFRLGKTTSSSNEKQKIRSGVYPMFSVGFSASLLLWGNVWNACCSGFSHARSQCAERQGTRKQWPEKPICQLITV